MEKRIILATALSFLILIGYQHFFVKPRLQTVQQPTAAVGRVPAADTSSLRAGAKASSGGEATGEKSAAVQAPEAAAVAAETQQDVVIDSSLFKATFSNQGAVLKSFKLKKHRSHDKSELELVNARAAELGRYPLSLWLEDVAAAASLNAAMFRTNAGTVVLKDGESVSIRFEYSDGKGLSAQKTFTFTGGKYELGLDLLVRQGGRSLTPFVIWGPGIDNLSPAEMKQRYSAVSGAAVSASGKVIHVDEKKYKPEQNGFNFVDWAAYEDNYFTALFVPAEGKGQALFIRETPAAPEGQQAPAAQVAPAYYVAVSEPVKAFIGPKEFDALKAFGHQAKKVINFGAFGAIAEVVLVMTKYFYKLIPNWGLAIILMTLVIKIIFFPLTYSSTKSMAKMAEMQPKLKAVQAKYKKAKTDIEQRRQMNEEMMKLYKEHGINPAGGCLPLLIQLPVFWGVFRMLVAAVELRQSPFVFWITDLSVRDPYYVTPILMGVTQFITQKMTPSTADPTQARMMMVMPFIMTIFFMNFQSGLVLYWLAQNVMQIGQQALMNKMMAKKKRESNGKRK